MQKTSLTKALMIAGALAVAGVGVAQAETFDSPTQAGEMSTMTNGQPNMETNNIGVPASTTYVYDYGYTTPSTTVLGAGPVTTYDYSYSNPTAVLGAGPATVTTYTYTYPASTVYVTPAPMVGSRYDSYGVMHDGASETSNVPQRAGEASTMTNGAPNLVTNNYGW